MSRWTTIEEKIKLLEAIMVCIEEHPIVGEWITEILDRKTESDSEKPNNCETCKHNKLEWYSEVCDGCSKAHSNYEPKTEPQKCYLRESCDHYGDKQVCGRCRHYNLYSHTKTEPQTDCETCLYAGECDWKQWQKCYSQSVRSNLEPFRVDEPQTDCAWKGEANE